MPLMSRIAAAFSAFGRRSKGTTRETYVFDRKKGLVELRADPRIILKMEMFKRFTLKKSWGFELTIRNRSTETIEEMLIVFNKKYSIIIDTIRPDSMKIKSLEFAPDEFDTEEFMVDMSVVTAKGKSAVSEAYSVTIPMSSIIRELKNDGRIIPIQEEEEAYKLGSVDQSVLQGFEAEFIKNASIKPRLPLTEEGKGAASTQKSRDELMRNLSELENQKSEITKSFMKREIDYTTFSQLMNPIVQEMILIKAKASQMDKIDK
ncbi:MAG: hypothetical protein V1835_00580 [Candidatus Micrarchaeota archaeon]